MKKFALLALILATNNTLATEVKISKPILYIEGAATYAVFNLEWKNVWKNDRNNDAIWLFCKLKSNEGTSKHILVLQSGHETVNIFSGKEAGLEFMPSKDGVGVFVFPKNEFKGTIEVTLKILLDAEDFDGADTRNSSFDVFGVEMVRIPSGSFFLGSSDPTTRAYGTFYNPKENTPIKIESENQEFEVSKNGNLYYDSSEGYEGDQKGQIPSSYPKGFQSFYIMKYELTEGQYVNFMNNLSQGQRQSRILHQEEGYSGTITLNDDRFHSEYPDRPCAFVGWDDAMAFADWAGLRPLTEFEYTKASRGTALPKGVDYPWGLKSKAHVQKLPDKNGNLVMLNGWDESQLSDDNKVYFGASHYWVMDLAGSLWERIITIGHERGRNFKGTHGDGVLTEDGKATNRDWPDGNEDSGGIGFRGGGFYGYNREYHEFNPFSPVSFRPYGGWHGAMRSVSYGTRFVRTAN